MSNDELFKALGMFEQGVRKAAVTSAINQAHQEVEQVNQQQVGLLEKRQAQTQLANGLALKLAGLGADPSQMQAAVGAIGPAAIKDSADMYQQGMMAGDQEAVGLANKMQSFETKWQRDSLNQTQAFTAQENQANRDNALEIAGLKSSKSGKVMPTPMMKKFDEIDKQQIQLQSLSEDISNGAGKYLGPGKSINWFGIRGNVDPEYGKFTMKLKQTFDDYRVAITGAGAGPSELKILEKSMISKEDTEDTIKGKIATLMDLSNKVKSRKAKRLKSLGYNIGDLEADITDSASSLDQQKKDIEASLPPGVPAGSTQGTFKFADGTTGPGWKTPQGKILRPKK